MSTERDDEETGEVGAPRGAPRESRVGGTKRTRWTPRRRRGRAQEFPLPYFSPGFAAHRLRHARTRVPPMVLSSVSLSRRASVYGTRVRTHAHVHVIAVMYVRTKEKEENAEKESTAESRMFVCVNISVADQRASMRVSRGKFSDVCVQRARERRTQARAHRGEPLWRTMELRRIF